MTMIYNIYNKDICGLYLAVGGLNSYLEAYLAFQNYFKSEVGSQDIIADHNNISTAEGRK